MEESKSLRRNGKFMELHLACVPLSTVENSNAVQEDFSSCWTSVSKQPCNPWSGPGLNSNFVRGNKVWVSGFDSRFQASPTILGETFSGQINGACCHRNTGASRQPPGTFLPGDPFLSCKAPVCRSDRLGTASFPATDVSFLETKAIRTPSLLWTFACAPTHPSFNLGRASDKCSCRGELHLPVQHSYSSFHCGLGQTGGATPSADARNHPFLFLTAVRKFAPARR